MSVITASISGLSSILKSPGFRKANSEQRVRFRLPDSLKTILLDFINKTNLKSYAELICTIRDGDIQDDDFLQILREVREYISLLDKNLHHFVDTLLCVQWVTREAQVVAEYQGFLLDLLSAHNYYTKNALERLMPVFKSVGCEEEWVGGVPTDSELRAFSHVHEVLKVLLQVVPMSRDILIQVVVNSFPYIRRPSHEHECYVHNILEIMKYHPSLHLELLLLVMKKLVALDVYAPRTEVLDAEDDEEFEMEPHMGMRHPVANTLDVVMVQLLRFVQTQCGMQDLENIRPLYRNLLAAFDQVVLTTYATHHVQFLLFFLCSVRTVMAEAFVSFLWRKVTSPIVAPVIRQSAVMYLGSLLARATYINVSMLKASLAEMSAWIHSYICSQDGVEGVNLDVRIHAVFYTICQALFYVIAFRHSDLVHSKKDLMFLQSLNLTKMVTCKLNPLRMCSSVVTQNFAAVTRTYQLAYCYSIIEHNARNSIPVIHDYYKDITASKSVWVDSFFPFDPFILRRSAHYIQPIYRSYQKPEEDGSCSAQKIDDDRNEKEDEDDFLVDEPPRNSVSSSPSFPAIFSYSSSPGFKWM